MGFPRVFCDVAGRRHMPGICWYPAKRTGHAVNQGGTADNCLFVLDRFYFLRGIFFIPLVRGMDRGAEGEEAVQ